MSGHPTKRVPWPYRWRDPMGVAHSIDKVTYDGALRGITFYETWCGHGVDIGDVNKSTQMTTPATCMKCISTGFKQ